MSMFIIVLKEALTCSEGCSLKPKFLEFVIRSVERDPTLASNPLVGALLNLITASCASINAPWSYLQGRRGSVTSK
jgi:hypothetical protein